LQGRGGLRGVQEAGRLTLSDLLSRSSPRQYSLAALLRPENFAFRDRSRCARWPYVPSRRFSFGKALIHSKGTILIPRASRQARDLDSSCN